MLATAYSLESVLIELIFILGPVLVAMFVALASPAAAVLFAAACGCAGTLLSSARRRSANGASKRAAARACSARSPNAGFVPLLVVVVCYASAFGLVEIGTTAYATEIGSPALAGVLLGVMSVGSAAGGLVYGSRSWRLPLARQFPLMLAVMGLGIAPLALLPAAWAFGLWCVAAGIAMAPALIMQSMLVAKNSRARTFDRGVYLVLDRHCSPAWDSGLTIGGALLEYAQLARGIRVGGGSVARRRRAALRAAEDSRARPRASGAGCRGATRAPAAGGRRAC